MPNPLPLGPGTRVLSGARAIFKFNGETVGFATGLTVGEGIRQEPIKTLDHLETREHVATSYDVSLSATVFRTVARGQVSDTDSPGSLKQQNIMPKFNQILRVEGCDVAVIDEITKKTIMLMIGVKTANTNYSLNATSTVLQNVDFVGIMVFDEGDDNLKNAGAGAA